MIMFLVVLGMLISRARDARNWTWLAKDDSEPVQRVVGPKTNSEVKTCLALASHESPAKEDSPPAKPEPEKAEPAKPDPATPSPSPEDAAPPTVKVKEDPTVGTDLDPEEADAAKEEFQALSDRTLFMRKEEMEAYYRVLGWVLKQSEPELRKRAASDVSFSDLVQDPDKYRGKLLHLKLNVRMINECPKTSRYDGTLYEVWGFTERSQRLYDIVVPELPEGMPLGAKLSEEVLVSGYFLKLQGYEPASAKPNAPPLYAPLIMGRVEWIQTPPVKLESNDWIWMVGLIGMLVIVGMVSLAMSVFARRRSRSSILTRSVKPGALSTDEWLLRAESGDLPEGNNPDAASDSYSGAPSPNG